MTTRHNDNSRDIISNILTITGKTTDNKRYVEEFITLTHAQAMLSLIETLPKEHQTKVTALFIALPDTPGKAEKIFSPYFTKEQMREALQRTIQTTMKDYISKNPDLSASQRIQCLAILEKLTCSSQAA
jgi:hypothetical protein